MAGIGPGCVHAPDVHDQPLPTALNVDSNVNVVSPDADAVPVFDTTTSDVGVPPTVTDPNERADTVTSTDVAPNSSVGNAVYAELFPDSPSGTPGTNPTLTPTERNDDKSIDGIEPRNVNTGSDAPAATDPDNTHRCTPAGHDQPPPVTPDNEPRSPDPENDNSTGPAYDAEPTFDTATSNTPVPPATIAPTPRTPTTTSEPTVDSVGNAVYAELFPDSPSGTPGTNPTLTPTERNDDKSIDGIEPRNVNTGSDAPAATDPDNTHRCTPAGHDQPPPVTPDNNPDHPTPKTTTPPDPHTTPNQHSTPQPQTPPCHQPPSHQHHEHQPPHPNQPSTAWATRCTPNCSPTHHQEHPAPTQHSHPPNATTTNPSTESNRATSTQEATHPQQPTPTTHTAAPPPDTTNHHPSHPTTNPDHPTPENDNSTGPAYDAEPTFDTATSNTPVPPATIAPTPRTPTTTSEPTPRTTLRALDREIAVPEVSRSDTCVETKLVGSAAVTSSSIPGSRVPGLALARQVQGPAVP